MADLPGLLGDNAGQIMRAIQRRAMAGLEPTKEQQAWLKEQAPRLEENQYRLLDALTPVPAMIEAYNDPSIANVTRAGIQTAATVGKPLAALGILGGGYATAAAKDLGLLSMDANAQTAAQSRARAGEAKAKAQAEADILRAKTEAERNAAEIEAQREANRLNADKSRSEKAEYDAAVGKAALVRDAELAARKSKPFAETEVGKLYDKTGIATPFLAAMGLAGLNRAAFGGGTKMKDYGIPIAEGVATGATMANWPLGHELIFQPAENPEKPAYRAYARELPPTHPRKQEWTSYAEGLPDANPSREIAARDFYDPKKLAERSIIGAVEGFAGGLAGPGAYVVGQKMGNAAVRGIGNAVEGAATLPGRAAQGYNKGMTGAQNEKLLRDFSEIRNKIAEAKGFKMDAEAEAALAAARARAASAPPEPVMPPQAPPAQPTAPVGADTPAGRARRYLNSY